MRRDVAQAAQNAKGRKKREWNGSPGKVMNLIKLSP